LSNPFFKQGGFTLIEAITTIVVSAALVTIGATFMSRGFLSYFVGKELASDAAQGTLALERMTRELRLVRSQADLTTMGANTITYVDTSGNTITYALSGGSITRSANLAAAQPLADNVSTLSFSYWQNNVSTAVTSTTVWYITVAVTVSSQNATATFRSTVKPVNF